MNRLINFRIIWHFQCGSLREFERLGRLRARISLDKFFGALDLQLRLQLHLLNLRHKIRVHHRLWRALVSGVRLTVTALGELTSTCGALVLLDAEVHFHVTHIVRLVIRLMTAEVTGVDVSIAYLFVSISRCASHLRICVRVYTHPEIISHDRYSIFCILKHFHAHIHYFLRCEFLRIIILKIRCVQPTIAT